MDPQTQTVTYNRPQGINLQELARVTERSLSFLEPWYNDDNGRSPALRSISTQAQKYALAINESVKAAQDGHNVATSALTLSALVKNETVSTTDCDNYAKLMLKCAGDAHQRCFDSLKQFRQVRQVLSELISNARNEGTGDQDQAELNKLEKDGIPVFEKLVKCVGDYIDWWNWIVLETNSQKLSAERLTFKYTKIRSDSTSKKWEELKVSFFDYTVEIQKAQDAHRKLLEKITEEQHREEKTPISEVTEVVGDQDLIPQIERITEARKSRRRVWASRAWSSISSFARSLMCL